MSSRFFLNCILLINIFRERGCLKVRGRQRLHDNSDFYRDYSKEILHYSNLSITANNVFSSKYNSSVVSDCDFHFVFVIHLISALYYKELESNIYGVGKKGDTIQ